MSKAVTTIAVLSFLAMCAFTGCAKDGTKTTAATQTTVAAPKADNVYTGKIVGKSEKAKTIAIAVGPEGKSETFLLKFTDATTGLQFANKEDAAIITYEVKGSDKIALTIKPKLAKLPEGVTEIKTPALQELLDKRTKMVLADARPESRYAQAHLPGAVSISVERLKKEEADALPPDKTTPLVFYCGGPT